MFPANAAQAKVISQLRQELQESQQSLQAVHQEKTTLEDRITHAEKAMQDASDQLYSEREDHAESSRLLARANIDVKRLKDSTLVAEQSVAITILMCRFEEGQQIYA